MEEVVPVVFGVIVAAVTARLGGRSAGLILALLACAAFGWLWSDLVGELAHHWAYALFDGGQAIVGCLAMRWLSRRYATRAGQLWNGRFR
ncbi:hypothetical protein SB861_40270 [Paraburkholderia sp. SIMBA_049]